MVDKDPRKMDDAEVEELLDNIETMLEGTISNLDVLAYLFRSDAHIVHPDEAIAAEQCRRDLQTVLESVQLRREYGKTYPQPERVDELIEKLNE